MKNRHILILFILSAVITVIGALFKVMHWPYASIMLIIGMGGEALCGILLIVKLMKGNKDSNSFLDS